MDGDLPGAAQRPHVVIIGGGFGGLNAARALAGASVRVTLLDRRNHHLFQPLLYQVATAALNPSDIAVPIRSILRRQTNVTVLLEDAMAVDPERNLVTLANGNLAFDYLIIATGVRDSYFGHDWNRLAPGLKSIEDALEMRRRILLAYEAAEREPPSAARARLLTFVVIGGGPTGVELAGALAEIARNSLPRDFRNIDTTSARVLLLEGGDRILPMYPESLSRAAERQLGELGVDVRVRSRVTAIDEDGVLANGERIDAATVLWAAGVEASPLVRSLGVPLDRAGRVIVRPDLTIPSSPRIFVIGDAASVEWERGAVPGVAPAAIQEGRHAARNILLAIQGRSTEEFRYRDKGSLATIGRAAGVGVIGRLRLHGWIAWVAWLAIHIFFLIGFRNRFLVMLEWAWSYLTFQRGARLITEGSGVRGQGSGVGDRGSGIGGEG